MDPSGRKLKLAVIGSRSLDLTGGQLRRIIAAGLERLQIDPAAIDTIVSGGADGIDRKARIYAERHQLRLLEHLPDYKRYGGKRAPLERNVLIARDCDAMIAVWDGQSLGTLHCAMKARKARKPVWVCRFVREQQAA